MATTRVEPSRGDVPAFVLLAFGASWLLWVPLAPGSGRLAT